MLTECPACMTVFRVTPAILKMGHGQVRCGKCRRQFDAIECMLDEEEEAALQQASEPTQSQPPPQDDPAPTQPPAPSFDESTYAEEVIMEGSRIEISGTYRIPDGATDAQPEKIVREHIVIDRGGPRVDFDESPQDEVHEIENVSLSGDSESIAEEDEDADDDVDSDETASSVTDAPMVPKRWQRTLAKESTESQNPGIHAELHALTQRERPRVLRTGVWLTIAAIFLVTLIAQVIHHSRDALVRDPRFGNTISRIYRALGLSPTPHWDLTAYKWDIYKVDLDPKIPDALRVVGSVANDAPFAQPYPLGKLALQDRWGASVGERAFQPSEYLSSSDPPDRLMAPKQRANIEIVIADPGTDAVGYNISACLEQDHRLSCADQLPVFR